jgi:2'-5' RNA ligase
LPPSRRAPAEAGPEAPPVPGAGPSQRLFFALWPGPALQQRLYDTGRALLAARIGRRLPPENLHLTLLFLGAVGAPQRDCLLAAAAAVRAPRFTLRLDTAGYWRRPQLLWLGCRETPAPLLSLVETVRALAADCSLTPESRPYVPHLTLVRKLRRPLRPAAPEAVDWEVDGFALVESRTDATGARYTPIASWRFQLALGTAIR